LHVTGSLALRGELWGTAVAPAIDTAQQVAQFPGDGIEPNAAGAAGNPVTPADHLQGDFVDIAADVPGLAECVQIWVTSLAAYR
jgi:hypothetical protein